MVPVPPVGKICRAPLQGLPGARAARLARDGKSAKGKAVATG